MTNYEIIIVGAGPSGCSAALMLGILDKNLANQSLLVDKAVFPRSKLCAGGITLDDKALLRQLGVRIEVPSVPIHISKFLMPNGVLTYQQTRQFEIVGRKEFDHDLFQFANDRGIQTQDAEAVQMLTRTNDGLIVSTSKNEYRAKIVIGADGANGSVRKLLPGSARRLMMGLEIFVPEGLISGYCELEYTAIFDFR
jgi:flavin-dependent dehydrogenase